MFRKITNTAIVANKSTFGFIVRQLSNTVDNLPTRSNAVDNSLTSLSTNASNIKEPNASSMTEQLFPHNLDHDDSSIAEESTAISNVLAEKPQRTKFRELSQYLRPGAVSSLYINKSEDLQQLLKLGVKFYKIEKKPEAFTFILGLKFEDYRDHIVFLTDLNIAAEKIGEMITKNPLLLKEHLDDLKVRINYLQYKKFTREMIQRIVETNANWLSHSTSDIDERLGFFQQNLLLSGHQVRQLAAKGPKLITWPLEKVKLNVFVFLEEMCFNKEELKKIVLDKPKLLMMDQNKILKTFEYLHNTMKVPLERIVEMPDILTCRQKRLVQRHLFLAEHNRAEYNPKNPKYVALTDLVYGDDSYFSTQIAKSSVQVFNTFLKSL